MATIRLSSNELEINNNTITNSFEEFQDKAEALKKRIQDIERFIKRRNWFMNLSMK